MEHYRYEVAVLCLLASCQIFSAQLNNLSEINSLKSKDKSIVLQLDPKNNSFFYKKQNFTIKKISENIDKAGKLHTRYIQVFNNIPVWGYAVDVHQLSNKNFNNHEYTGNVVSNLAADLKNYKFSDNFDEKNALLYAKKVFNSEHKLINNLNDDKVYQNERSDKIIYLDDNHQARFAFKISYFISDSASKLKARPFYIIDANSKKVLNYWDGLTTDRVNLGVGPGGNDKSGRWEYGTDKESFEINRKNESECYMNSQYVRTVDMMSGTYNNKTFHYECYRHEGDEINGAASPLNDANFHANKTIEMFNKWYDVLPMTTTARTDTLDSKPKLLVRAHYDVRYENAFWNGSSITIGDGGSEMYPLTSLDVISHEIAHAFTERYSDLMYMGESGGINESFSDMTAKVTEYYVKGENNWDLGREDMKYEDALRYLDLPEKDGHSISHTRDYNINLNVHSTSGVFNKAFYLLATTNDWDTRKAYDVFELANKSYWTAYSSFSTAAMGAIKAARSLDLSTQDVIDAFYQVGIDCNNNYCITMRYSSSQDTDDDMDVDDDIDDVDMV